MTIAMDQLLKEPLLYDEIFAGKDKLKSPWELSAVFKRKSIFAHSKSFPKIDKIYIYDPTRGVYKEYTINELTLFFTKMFEMSRIAASMQQIKQVVESVKFHLNAEFGIPKFDTQYLAFDNGLFNLQTGNLVDWTPSIFITSRMEGIWPIDDVEPVEFKKFLSTFCEGDIERMNFIRVVFWAAFVGYTQAQILLLMEGPGASGKSTVGQVLEALVGMDYCVSTTFRELNRSPFETTTLRGKKLIFFNDMDNCKGDMSLLKQLVGGDTIRGRVKHKMEIVDFKVEALIVMASNQPVFHTDAGNSLGRRIRLFPAHNVIPPSERKNLLSRTRDGYVGLLAPEIPHIRKWAYETLRELPRAKDYLHLTTTMVPSLAAPTEEASENMNPILAWIKEELEVGTGSYVGFKMKLDSKSSLEVSRRKLLYPTYRVWAEKRDMHPLGHKRFANELIWTLNHLGIKAEKIRRNEGMFISGITVKGHVYNHDNIYGAPLQLGSEGPPESSEPGSQKKPGGTYAPPEKYKQHPALIPDLYDCYKMKLEKTPLKIHLNDKAKGLTLDIEKLVNIYFKDVPEPSPFYRDRMTQVFSNGSKIIKKNGAIPYKYKPMGTSPRILPISYGTTINNTKRILRQEVYSYLGKYLNETQNKVIIDLDLRSCYTSIVIGLYPDVLEALQIAIEGEGLWKYISKEFENNGKGHVYKKGPVKICVYSSFFMGGSKAMIEGILDQFRKDIGLAQTEFKGCPDYEYFHTIAREVAKEMQNSSVITDFRAVSNKIREDYMGEELIGPTGHNYRVTEDSFRVAYPNYLQSFEFALLADTTLRVMREFKDVELIGHFHDGNVLIIPKGDTNPFVKRFTDKLEELGRALGLRYPQRIELKEIYE